MRWSNSILLACSCCYAATLPVIARGLDGRILTHDAKVYDSQSGGVTTLPVPESIVSCPGMKRSSINGFKCKDTPVRYQVVVPVPKLRDAGILDCDNYDYSRDSDGTNSYNPADSETSSDPNRGCDPDGKPCADSRDCCSNYCLWVNDKSESVCRPPEDAPAYRRNLRNVVKDAPVSHHRQLTHDESGNKACVANAECASYRCKDGFCDDGISQGFAGSDGCKIPTLQVMYTLQLEGKSNPGDPSVNNSAATVFLRPGEFGEISFPGNLVIRTRLKYCGVYNNYQCVLGPVSTISVDIPEASNSPHEDALPKKDSNDVYVRSAITFDRFDVALGKFNISAFKSAVMDALNTDRLEYSAGAEEGKQQFAEVKHKDVSVVLVDHQLKTVQFEVRTMKEKDAVQLSARMLHAYFKFPLAIFLSKYGVLDENAYSCAWGQASQIHIKATGASLLRSEKSVPLVTAAGLATAAIIFIILGGILVCAGVAWVIARSREQAKVATMLSYKAESLNKREAKLAEDLEKLEKQKNDLVKEMVDLQRNTAKREEEYAAAQEKLKVLASRETSVLEDLTASLDAEHEQEVTKIEAQLAKEKEQLLKELENGGPQMEIALDADTIEHRMDALVICAGTSAAQTRKDLEDRHAKIRARVAHRNELRRANLTRKLEQEEAHALAELNTAKQQQRDIEIRVGDLIVSSVQDAETLQRIFEKRKAAVLQRTSLRNEKRKAEMERRLAMEMSDVMAKVPPNQDIKLEASLVADDHNHEAHGLELGEVDEENDILGDPAYDDVERVTTIMLRADMAKDEIYAQLAKRREVLLARTQARNEHRKRMRINAKRKELSDKMPDEARRASMEVHRLHDLVKASQAKLKNNQNKVKRLEAEAEQHRKELDDSLAARQDQKRIKLRERIAKKKKLKEQKQSEKI